MTAPPTSSPTKVAENLARVRQRIAEAARRAGRQPTDITLVGVTKYASLPAIRQLVAAGCRDLGESRPQQLWERRAALAAALTSTPETSGTSTPVDLSVRWHLIGHLQRNKVHRTLTDLHLVHSGDSQRLLEACGAAAVELGRTLPVLLEVNISGDAAKQGFAPRDLPLLLAPLAAIRGIEIRGLMAMSGLHSDAAEARRQFAAVRQLRDQLQRDAPPHVRLDDLSMGMSDDFEIAVEEGATLVRIGSALFAGVDG